MFRRRKSESEIPARSVIPISKLLHRKQIPSVFLTFLFLFRAISSSIHSSILYPFHLGFLFLGFQYLMSTERKRKVSLFDVVDDTSLSTKLSKSVNGGSIKLPSGINRWNAKPFSQRYYDILEKRKTLPVWQQKDDFLKVLKENQTLVLVGETGSGKTTQVKNLLRLNFCTIFFLFNLFIFVAFIRATFSLLLKIVFLFLRRFIRWCRSLFDFFFSNRFPSLC